MAKKTSQRLVIDVDVAQSAGAVDATDARAISCRSFLESVRDFSHRIVMTREILDEWQRHRSRFSHRWLTSMHAHKNVENLSVPGNEPVKKAIDTHAESETAEDAMLKDLHLISAALETDQRIASLDNKARNLFGDLSEHAKPIRTIVWVNPNDEADAAIQWLEDGAPADESRMLGARGS